MATTYNYKSSKTTSLSEIDENSILVNSLVEKRKYIYFKRGPYYSPNYECGDETFKMRKEEYNWEPTGNTCINGKIFRIYKSVDS